MTAPVAFSSQLKTLGPSMLTKRTKASYQPVLKLPSLFCPACGLNCTKLIGFKAKKIMGAKRSEAKQGNH
jgi:hypothetical protein